MKSSILIIILLIFFGCKNSNERDLSKIKNINDVIETIIIKDSLDVLKKQINSKMLCKDLIQMKIYIPKKGKIELIDMSPPDHSVVSIDELVNFPIDNKPFFTSKDSLEFISQTSENELYEIEKSLLDKSNVTTVAIEKKKRRERKKYDYYEISTPLFSKDKTKAYVEVNYYSSNHCGSGWSLYLLKSNGEWKIIDKLRLWIS